MHKLQSDNHAIVVDKTPTGVHIRRFNAPVIDDVAAIMVGDHTATQEIVIRRRNNYLEFIADTPSIRRSPKFANFLEETIPILHRH